jgi:hypothetical protein
LAAELEDQMEQPYYEDRLVRRFRVGRGQLRFHGKRVGRGCPLTREEVRAYVEKGVLACMVLMKQRLPEEGLAGLKARLDEARGDTYSEWKRRP